MPADGRLTTESEGADCVGGSEAQPLFLSYGTLKIQRQSMQNLNLSAFAPLREIPVLVLPP